MAKNKGVRLVITLECTECRSNPAKRSPGVSRYTTQKNRRNTTERLELKKFCPHCNSSTVHRKSSEVSAAPESFLSRGPTNCLELIAIPTSCRWDSPSVARQGRAFSLLLPFLRSHVQLLLQEASFPDQAR